MQSEICNSICLGIWSYREQSHFGFIFLKKEQNFPLSLWDPDYTLWTYFSLILGYKQNYDDVFVSMSDYAIVFSLVDNLEIGTQM